MGSNMDGRRTNGRARGPGTHVTRTAVTLLAALSATVLVTTMAPHDDQAHAEAASSATESIDATIHLTRQGPSNATTTATNATSALVARPNPAPVRESHPSPARLPQVRRFPGIALKARNPAPSALEPGEQPFSIGNRVWSDDGSDGGGGFNAAQRNDGLQNVGETGVNGVRVELYRDEDASGAPDAAEFVRFDITEAGGPGGAGRPGPDLNGYYLFDGLEAGTYFVVIPATEFATGRPLAGRHSSSFSGTETVGATGATGLPATDLDDNGIEPATRRPDVNGVRSGAITFVAVPDASPGLEVTGETDLSDDPDPGFDQDGNGPGDIGPTNWDGPGSIGRWSEGPMLDDSSNVAVDFGFIPPMSIGNRIWLDDSSDPAQWANGGSRNNGLVDATDDGNLTLPNVQNPGVAGVDVQLYYDENTNNFIDPGDTLVATTITATNGYYLFDGLMPGNYIIRVPSSEFGSGQPLDGLISSFDAVAQTSTTNQTDSNDNGIDVTDPVTAGVSSRQIQLVYLGEATGESDIASPVSSTTLPGPQSRGRFGETDVDSDLTIDFGFVRPPMSIGNQVWFDDHPTAQAQRNNGLFDAGETALAGVEVGLYRDLDTDGVVDGGEDTGLIDTTSGSGFYLFDNLPPGSYIVAVTAVNFNAGGPLQNMISSRSVAPNPLAADNQTDNNDNGIDTFVAGVGIQSSRIVLTAGAEPTAEVAVNDPADGVGGRGKRGETDRSSDVTIDFGFYVPMSLGNRVWLDDSDDPSRWSTTRNNAVLDSLLDDLDNPNVAGVQPLGVAGATLRLYRDLDADGVVDSGEDTGRTTQTNTSGRYLFDGLSRGHYIVGVEALNFASGGPLSGFVSSASATTPTDSDLDNLDDGRGTTPSPLFGVIGPSIVLSYNSPTSGLEPLAAAEPDPTPQLQADRGSNGEFDAFSNLTIDFGFTRPATSLGNVVWSDDHPTNQSLRANGLLDPGESVIAGVELALFRDLDADGNVDGGEDTGLRDTTGVGGFYLFADLPPGGYIVSVTAANFGVGGPLRNMISTPSVAPNTVADDQVDGDDNGIDAFVAGIGITSGRIVLVAGTEPSGESPVNGPADGVGGRGTRGEADNTSDLTVDFGFYVPMSLGNRIWIDDSDDPASVGTTRNNAALDPTADDLDNPNTAGADALGVAGVTLRLYQDLDADGVVDPGEDSGRTAFSDASGHYLFDGLPRGSYVVGVDSANFDAGSPLSGFASSTNSSGATDDDLDSTDHGVGVVPSPTTGVISPSILLAYVSPTSGLEPVAGVGVGSESDPNPQLQSDRGQNGELDAFSNLTIDFGFVLVDTTPPVLDLPDDIIREATGPMGTDVSFVVSAFDEVDGSRIVSCTPAAGSTIPIGVQTVDCTTSDSRGNIADGAFTITVVDTLAPTFPMQPTDVTREATGPDGATVTYPPPSAIDAVGAGQVVCTPTSGDTFPVGTSEVTCTSTDAAGNTGTTSFTVTVEDTTAPVVFMASDDDIVAEAQGPDGATVMFTAPVASDAVGSAPVGL